MRKCQDIGVIPKGLRLKFNLANGVNDPILIHNIQTIIDEGSSRILDKLLCYGERNQTENYEAFLSLKQELVDHYGMNIANNIVRNIKMNSEPCFETHKLSLNKKLNYLERERDCDEILECTGSRRLTGVKYKPRNLGIFMSADRPHRKNRWKERRNKRRNENQRNCAKPHSLCDEDIARLNPEVLSENVQLTETDKSVLRLSDKFAMTPRSPLDVHDMAVGTYRWAESIRWTYFWYHWKLGKAREREKAGYQDLNEDDLQAFEKTPWYRRTDRPAPQASPEVENFISGCQDEFLDPKNRRKIKGNFSKEELKSAIKLRNLPLTHNAACRFADKSSKTIITDMEDDDNLIMNDLNDPDHDDRPAVDPTPMIKETIDRFALKWREGGVLDEEQYNFITDIDNTEPSKVKPLVKTHKSRPWPIRLLLSGSNTPVQPLSKFVQHNIRHLPSHLPHQVLDVKEFLQKIDYINKTISPLPSSTRIVICDVSKLYPSVNNLMGVPAVRDLLSKFPSPYTPLTNCIIEALQICLDCNVCRFMTGDGRTHIRVPNRGTAMGPCHACDYADVFMGVLDKSTVELCPVPLLSSLLPETDRQKNTHLNWSRFRDDGITFLLTQEHVPEFEKHLQSLHEDIDWEVSCGEQMNYLNLTVKLENGEIHTDEYSKSSHNYLPPHSCHPPATFKGLISSKGIQLRMNCSHSKYLKPRLREYSKYFAACGWNEDKAYRELCRGADYNPRETEEEATQKREKILFKPRKKKPKKIPWVTTWDPRAPPKDKILKKNAEILYRNKENLKIFPKDMLISSNRRRPNLGEFIKPTIPRRFVFHGPFQEQGCFPCTGANIAPCKKGACDLCKHIQIVKMIKSPYDSRTWKIRQNLTCSSPNLIYLIICNEDDHRDYAWYVGSAGDMKIRWRNHKSDFLLGKCSKSGLAGHSIHPHPRSEKFKPIQYLQVILLESVGEKATDKKLLDRELWWQTNIGTLFFGLNKRNDTRSVVLQSSRFKL